MNPTAPIAIGLGANQGDSVRQIQAASRAIGALEGMTSLVLSPLYRTRSVGPVVQPDFVNAVCCARTTLAPRPLLAALAALEINAGRVWDIPMGPRPLDLDLLLHGDAVIESPDLVLPHPRMATRGFVLVPLADLAPDWRHPTLKRTIAELRAAWEADLADPRAEVWPLQDEEIQG